MTGKRRAAKVWAANFCAKSGKGTECHESEQTNSAAQGVKVNIQKRVDVRVLRARCRWRAPGIKFVTKDGCCRAARYRNHRALLAWRGRW